MMDEKEYLDLFNSRRDSGEAREHWLDVSQDILRQFLKTDPVQAGDAALAVAAQSLQTTWSDESRLALDAAAFCFWYKPLLRATGKDRFDPKEMLSVEMREILEFSKKLQDEFRQSLILTRLAHASVSKPDAAYESYQKKFFDAIVQQVQYDRDIQNAARDWPRILSPEGCYLSEALASGRLLPSLAIGNRIQDLKPSLLARNVIRIVRAAARELYPDCFDNLPHIEGHIFDSLEPENEERRSGSHHYHPPSIDDPQADYAFDLRDGLSMASPAIFVSSNVHEIEHILQAHLAWMCETKKMGPDHKLHAAARAFDTFSDRAMSKDGAMAIMTLLPASTPLGQLLRKAYVESPREAWAWRLDLSVEKKLAAIWGRPQFKRTITLDEKLLYAYAKPKLASTRPELPRGKKTPRSSLDFK